MKVTVIAKNIQLTNALKEAVEKKISKLSKYFNSDVEAKATLSVQKNRQKIEVTIPFNGVILRGEESTEDMYKSIDLVEEKLERQIRKQKTKLARRQTGDSLRFSAIESLNGDYYEDEDAKIVKTKRFTIKPMNEEEALLQMELLGHSFFVFSNAETGDVNVLYKRKDGNYGLIEPEY
ncbi:SSU ribosomal protein S30P /sigma 54 modulation protein [Clostridium amylolyticum]|uniref:Ribosome hibernation promoting factor n=1 Tax=Clostridium amylolyticum TaxID=1121298 RepID=A0A1M6BB15_9CLOT|nr:ribosome-associated translation inhibitor RaiA [Clostridium amylolyticum]SHI45941.1 SSU ribosomal protein S30P /sigma 54 modulation protein [Clostridium amylolyticum]